MNYPFWDAGISYGVLMAIVAVIHVFISHFAIGGGLYLVVTEHRARKNNDPQLLAFLEGLSKFFVMVSVVSGALTGVGIWFVIGLLNPAATEVLIHNFVWGWGTEWTFFVVEIAAALLYYYGWKRMSGRDHLIIGWIYFGAAWLSLVVINGIVTFMLTPGSWLETGNFWDGFLNPTYWPSLLFRTGICIMLAGLFALVVASRYPADRFKTQLVRSHALWGLLGLAIMTITFYWYWEAIPADVLTTAQQSMPTPLTAIYRSYGLAVGIAFLLILFGLILPRLYRTTVAIIVMALALTWFGEFEWFRESVRKPYVIYGFMYGNALELTQSAAYQQEGILSHMKYRTGDDGADLFRRACQSCHSIKGYKALAPRFDGTDNAFIAASVRGTHLMKGNMPPFLGVESEAQLLAAYLYSQMDRRALGAIHGLQGSELGRKVYDVRCGGCHWAGGPSDKLDSLAGRCEQDYSEILDNAADLGDGMPAFTASAEDRAALIAYLLTLREGGRP